MKRIQIESQRLVLTTSSKSMAEEMKDFYLKNKKHFAEWENAKLEAFYTKAYQKRLISLEKKNIANGNGIDFWIIKKENGALIGKVSVFGIIGGNFSSCVVGYKLDEQNVGCGYMSEALMRLEDFLFTDLNLRRIEINIMPRNDRSVAVVRRLGYELEGLIKEYILINGVWEDHLRFVKVNRNWRDI